MSTSTYDFKAKFIFVGSSGVGKSCLIHRLVTKDSAPAKEVTVPTKEAAVPTEEATVPTEEATVPTEEATVPTEEATVPTKEATLFDYSNYSLEVNNKSFLLDVWDTAGQERFNGMTTQHLRNAACAFVVYDISNPKTFQVLQAWVDKVRTICGSETAIFIIGNKTDLGEEKREVYREQGQNFADINCCYFEELSAKNKTQINIAIKRATEVVYEQIRFREPRQQFEMTHTLAKSEKKTSSCCSS
ncbi:MAG: P-loop containing nucleoside triphosphate hydrolase protein [Podila humilis]|nr:MAG: P-loop containing nucleoside triphosphate hydrolase protein [Podila humilis]